MSGSDDFTQQEALADFYAIKLRSVVTDLNDGDYETVVSDIERVIGFLDEMSNRCAHRWQGYRCSLPHDHTLPHHAYTDPYGVGTLTWDHTEIPKGVTA